MRRRILMTNAVFLVVVGVVQVALCLAAHLANRGPLSGVAGPGHAATALGITEAFSLAALLGVVLFRAGLLGGGRFWHGVAGALHALLFTYNLTFWSGMARPELLRVFSVATVAHAIFASLHAACLLAWIPDGPSPASHGDEPRAPATWSGPRIRARGTPR